MKLQVRRSAGLAVLLAAAGALPAAAQQSELAGNPQYAWWQVCGGNISSFSTCAAVDLFVNQTNPAGGTVTVRVWNMSGLSGLFSPPPLAPNWAGTVFTAIGFYNIGDIYALPGSLHMSGGVDNRQNPSSWVLQNDQDPDQGREGSSSLALGGINLEMISFTTNGLDDGIGSHCRTGDMSPTSGPLWLNPCSAADWDSDAGWVTMSFDFERVWGPVSSTDLLIKGRAVGPGGELSLLCATGEVKDCHNVSTRSASASEPGTAALLLAGLAGLAALRGRNRRRAEQA